MRIIQLCFLLFVFCNCGRKSINDPSSFLIIDLFKEPESEVSMVSDISTYVDYIPLQTTSNSLVESIDKLVICNKKIYIKNSIKEILSFDQEGNFLFNLNKTGRGPYEYKYIVDFDISKDNKTLAILTGDKILIFSINDSKLLLTNSINLKPPYPSRIDMIIGTNNFLLSIDPMTGSEYFLNILININGDTLHLKPNYYRFERTNKFLRGMANESLHYRYGNILCFKEEFSDTVFFC